MAAFESLPEWLEQAAGIMADPVYVCMAEEGDEPDDDVHPALAEQQQIIIHDQIANPIERTGTEQGNERSASVTDAIFAKTIKTLMKSKKSFEDKLVVLERMGMAHEDAIDALCTSDEE